MNAGSLRFGIVAALMLATALLLQAHSRSESFPPRASLSSLPLQIDGWTGTDNALDQEWQLVPVGDGTYKILNRASHLQLAAATSAQGAQLVQSADDNAARFEQYRNISITRASTNSL